MTGSFGKNWRPRTGQQVITGRKVPPPPPPPPLGLDGQPETAPQPTELKQFPPAVARLCEYHEDHFAVAAIHRSGGWIMLCKQCVSDLRLRQ